MTKVKECRFDEELKQLKIDCVKAGLLARGKESEAWNYYSKMIDKFDNTKKIKLLEKQIDKLKLKSFNSHARQEKIRHKKIESYFEKWHNLSFQLKFHGIKISGRKEDLEKTLVELQK